MTPICERLRACPFCAVDIEEACPMEDGTAVCYHRHTEGNCILDGMWFPQSKWNTQPLIDQAVAFAEWCIGSKFDGRDLGIRAHELLASLKGTAAMQSARGDG